MTLHFDWFRAPRWLAHAHFSRAVSLVLGVIGVSLLFGALRVVDVAISGALIERPVAESRPSLAPDSLLGSDPPSAGVAPVDASTTVDVPAATAEAVSL